MCVVVVVVVVGLVVVGLVVVGLVVEDVMDGSAYRSTIHTGVGMQKTHTGHT